MGSPLAGSGGGAASAGLAYRDLSLWHDTAGAAGDPFVPRRPLDGDLDVDVAIVGAGFTGLWTAYYLARQSPSLRIAVLERDVAGFGASGRNGGWCSALFPASLPAVARRSSREGALALTRALQSTVDEVGKVAADEGIDADFAKGGTLTLARTELQLARAQAELAQARAWGLGPDDLRLLDASETRARVDASDVRGALLTPHCAAVHPAKLVRGLAEAVERRGVRVFERTPVRSVEPGVARTARGTVRAGTVVRATEGYTASLAGQRRWLAPVYSLVVATEPLPAEVLERVGLRERETFTDLRHLIIYGQRTADGRLVFGGRGAPYHFGSSVRPQHDRDERVFAALRSVLVELFPALAGVRFTHAWGGALGVPRDWHAAVGSTPDRRFAWAGGYVGDGVGASNLAGRTLADLILGTDSDLLRLPWVGHRWRHWEPEPLRWLGVNAGLQAMTWADHAEERRGRPSRLAGLVGRLTGH